MAHHSQPGASKALRKNQLVLVLSLSFLFVFWSPALKVPFWQDDYVLLLEARKARLEGKPWSEVFTPDPKQGRWLPLSVGLYWRFIERFLGGNVYAAHLMNLLLLLLAAIAVGWFATTLAGFLAPRQDSLVASIASAFLYGIHASHFLPATWATAANDSICVLFSALTLCFWLKASTPNRRNETLALSATLVCFILALLSKETAFLLPLLGALLTVWLWPKQKPSSRAWLSGIASALVALIWLIIYKYNTTSPGPAYQLQFGGNVIRNTLSLILFFFNIPREALRFVLIKSSQGAAIWGLTCLLFQLLAFLFLCHSASNRIDKKSWLILLAFFIVGCAPFYLLSWNCYAYYVSISLLAYAIIAALAVDRNRIFSAALLLAVVSSTISTYGNYFLEYPALIGRANWAENQLQEMVVLRKTHPELFSGQLYLMVENEHKFQGIGIAGIAYRLHLELDDIIVIEPGALLPDKKNILIVPDEGTIYFKNSW